MKTTRKRAAAVFFGALIIFGMQPLTAAAQDDDPRDLGQNKGTGNPVKRVGSWDLVRIKTTAKGFDTPRETKDLPVDTRERSGISWGKENTLIKAAVVFMDLKKTVGGNNAGASDPSLKVLVKTEITRLGAVGEKNDFVAMRCIFDFTLASGETRSPRNGWSARQFKIYPAHYPAFKREEFNCGGDLGGASLRPGEDFTLNYKLQVYNLRADPVDVTYHFYYEWAGWRNESSGTPTTIGDGTSSSAKQKLKVEEIPDDEITATNNQTRPKPTVEEIPDEEITVVKSDGGNDASTTETTTKGEQSITQPQPPASAGTSSGPDLTGRWTRTLRASGERLFTCLNNGPQTYREEMSSRGNNTWRVRSTLLSSPCSGDYDEGRVGATVEFTLTVKNDGAGYIHFVLSDDQNRSISGRVPYNGSQFSYTDNGGGTTNWTWTRQ